MNDAEFGRQRRRAAAAHAALFLATVTFSVWNVLAELIDARLPVALLLCAARDSTALALLCIAWPLRRAAAKAALGVDPRCGAGYFDQQEQNAARVRDRATPFGWDWALLVGVGLSGPFMASMATVFCSEWAGADVTSILNALTPACTSLLSLATRLERFTWRFAVGVILATASGLIAARGGAEAEGAEDQQRPRHLPAGYAAGSVMVGAQAGFYIMMKPLFVQRGDRDPLANELVITTAYAFAAAASVLVFCVEVVVDGFPFAGWGWVQTWCALYAGAVCGALNYSLIAWASSVVTVTACALYGALQPPCTAVIALLFQGEALTRAGVISMVLALLSLVTIAGSGEGGPRAHAVRAGERNGRTHCDRSASTPLNED